MGRPVPFFFCRYQLLVDGDTLDYRGQLTALRELQGQFFAHGPTNEALDIRDTAIMRPNELRVSNHRALTWSVGRKIGRRVSAGYDADSDRINLMSVDDPGINYADFVAIPHLGVLAVDDRTGAPHLGGKTAIGRFRSVFSNMEDGHADIELTTSTEDVHRALEQWDVSEFSFIIRPFNPHPPGILSANLSEELKKAQIGRLSGKAKPMPGLNLNAEDEGQIAAVVELSDAGYGQYGLKGTTSDGHTAEIKKPPFDLEKRKNEKRQTQPRELRLIISSEDDEVEIFREVVKALAGFYGTTDRAT